MDQTYTLEDASDFEALLPIYLEIAASDAYYADDAAYRAWTLARRAGDDWRAREALRYLVDAQPNWLAYRATGELPLCVLPDYPPEASAELTQDVMARVETLELLGLDHLAQQELRLTALVSETPEVIVAMAGELMARGKVTQAWSLGRAYLDGHPCAPRAVWELAYPRPYSEFVVESGTANDVAPGLIWR